MIKFCSLFSGSSGNCLFISFKNTKILIDTGLSGIKIQNALCSIGEAPAEINAILISHEHRDHVHGAGVLSRKFDIPIYSNAATWGAMENIVGDISEKNRICFDTNIDFEIGNIGIKAFNIPHDASEPVGFSFYAKNKKVTTATDIGHINHKLLSFLEGSELLFLESNHDIEMLKVGRYPWELKKRVMGDKGHLSNEVAGSVVAQMVKKGTRRFLLGHLSQENNFPELAYRTVKNVLDEEFKMDSDEIFLKIAHRDRVGEIVCV